MADKDISFEEWKALGLDKMESPAKPAADDFEAWQKAGRPVAQIAQEQSMLDKLMAPNPPENIPLPEALKQIGISAGLSAAIGQGMGIPWPVGAAGGALSSVAEQVGKNMGASDLEQFAYGFLGGEVPVAIKAAASNAHNLVAGYNYRLGRLTSAFNTKGDKQKAFDEVVLRTYGKPFFEVSTNTKNQDEALKTLSDKFLDGNFPTTGTVSGDLREKLYSDLLGLQNKTETIYSARQGSDWLSPTQEKAPKLFSKSHWSVGLDYELKNAIKNKDVSREEYKHIMDVLKNESDAQPEVRAMFGKTMLRLIQDGGTKIKSRDSNGVIQYETLLGENAQKILKNNFDLYLQENLGDAAYSTLKQVEQAEGIARARDHLPLILNDKFKTSTKEFRNAKNYLVHSPEGKQELAKALLQHFGSLKSAEKMNSEYVRLAPVLREAKLLSQDEMFALRKKVESFDAKVANREAYNFWFKQAVLSPLLSASTSTSVDTINKGMKKGKFTL